VVIFLVSSILSPSVPQPYTSQMPSYVAPNRDHSPIVSSREQSPEIIRTNTLAVTPLPRSFFQPVILQLLRVHFSSFGAINQWVPLPGFSRIIIVYEQEDYAENAKLCSDPIILSATKERYVNLYNLLPLLQTHEANCHSDPKNSNCVYIVPTQTHLFHVIQTFQ